MLGNIGIIPFTKEMWMLNLVGNNNKLKLLKILYGKVFITKVKPFNVLKN